MLIRTSFESRLLRRAIFSRPTRLVWPPSWAGHIPFAFWFVDALRPRTLVELGTHTGLSYSAFAQAVQTLGLDTACYAIDTWQGDEHAGYYAEDVFTEWSAFHSRHFGGFSRLIRSTFDEALTHFSDGSIDALHIDGLHTHDAVRHDFESWLPKLSDRSVVLVHDVNVREREFGVWQYWEELRERYPSFTFNHGHGLGVLAVGRSQSPDIEWLTALPRWGDESADVQRVFSTIGDLWTQYLEADHARALSAESMAAREGAVAQMSEQLRRAHEAEAQLRGERDAETARLTQIANEHGADTARVAQIVNERDAATARADQIAHERDAATTRADQIACERDAATTRADQIAHERDLSSQTLAELTSEHHEIKVRLEAMTSASAAALEAEVEHTARLEIETRTAETEHASSRRRRTTCRHRVGRVRKSLHR